MRDRRLEHYQVYMKVYGYFIMELSEDEAEVRKIMDDSDELGPLLQGLRCLIEHTPFRKSDKSD